jgi:hypothetical protein
LQPIEPATENVLQVASSVELANELALTRPDELVRTCRADNRLSKWAWHNKSDHVRINGETMAFGFRAEFVDADQLVSRLSFLDRDDETSEHYFIMDRSEESPEEAVTDMGNVYIERDDQCWGGYGGIDRVVLERNCLTLQLGPRMAEQMGGHEAIRISFDLVVHFTISCGVAMSRGPSRFPRASSKIVAGVCDPGRDPGPARYPKVDVIQPQRGPLQIDLDLLV